MTCHHERRGDDVNPIARLPRGIAERSGLINAVVPQLGLQLLGLLPGGLTRSSGESYSSK